MPQLVNSSCTKFLKSTSPLCPASLASVSVRWLVSEDIYMVASLKKTKLPRPESSPSWSGVEFSLVGVSPCVVTKAMSANSVGAAVSARAGVSTEVLTVYIDVEVKKQRRGVEEERPGRNFDHNSSLPKNQPSAQLVVESGACGL